MKTHALLGVALVLPGCDAPSQDVDAPATSTFAPCPEPRHLPELGPVERLVEGVSPEAVVRRGALVYVADGHGVTVHRMLADGRLEAGAHVLTPGYASDLALAGETLLVADGCAGLTQLSLATPDRPVLLPSIPMPGPVWRLAGSEHGVAALLRGGALAIVRPGLPPAVVPLPAEPQAAAWIGPELYVADTGDGLVRVRTEPWPPRVVDRDRRFRSILSLLAIDGRLLVGHQDKRVELLDVSGPAPVVLDHVIVDHVPSRILGLDARVIVAGPEDGSQGATLVEVTPPGALAVLGRDGAFVAGAALVEPSLAVVAQRAGGLATLSLEPFGRERRAVRAGLSIDRVSADEQLVVAWGDDRTPARAWYPAPLAEAPTGAVVVRRAVPCAGSSCTLVGAERICHDSPSAAAGAPRACHAVAERGVGIAWQPGAERLWLIDASGSLQGFVKAPAPEAFRLVASAPQAPTVTRTTIADLVLDQERAVAIDSHLGLLHALTLGDRPRRHATFLLQSPPTGVALENGVALVATRTGAQLVDVSDPDRPLEIGWLPLDPGPLGIAASWSGVGRVALAEGEAGVSLWAWNGRDTLSPIGHVDTPGVASGVAFAADHLWIADHTGVLRVPLPEAGS